MRSPLPHYTVKKPVAPNSEAMAAISFRIRFISGTSFRVGVGLVPLMVAANAPLGPAGVRWMVLSSFRRRGAPLSRVSCQSSGPGPSCECSHAKSVAAATVASAAERSADPMMGALPERVRV
jgi:hypothetical protein